MKSNGRNLIDQFPEKGKIVDYGPDDPEETKRFHTAVLMAASGMLGIVLTLITMGVVSWLGQKYDW